MPLKNTKTGTGASRQTTTAFADASEQSGTLGRVWLIGCGPGDPELITLKAARLIATADVLIYDRLVDPAILNHARTDAEKIYVGKKGYGSSTPQEEINALLLERTLSGQKVARLKGGDAFVFARATEELATLQSAGVTVEVVPGITAAHACAASLQLPLTQRQLVQQITLVTGTSAEGDIDVDWPALAKPGQASAIYMGVMRAPLIQRRLLVAGADPDTSIVIIENGTRPEERTIATTLADLAEAMQDCAIHGPAIIFLGLDWAAAGLQTPEKIETFPALKSTDNSGKAATSASCKHLETQLDLRRHG